MKKTIGPTISTIKRIGKSKVKTTSGVPNGVVRKINTKIQAIESTK